MKLKNCFNLHSTERSASNCIPPLNALGKRQKMIAKISFSLRYLFPFLFSLFLSVAGFAQESLLVLPESFVLGSKGAEQQLLLEKRDGERYVGQIREGIVWGSSHPQVVKIVDNRAIAVGDGTATITAIWQGQTATTQAQVRGSAEALVWEFHRHVLPILAKRGCNSGVCHGALAGKNGFKLSLRGYDPLTDHWVLTREARGRRIEPGDPGRSLILAKPSGGLPHKGGLRFEVDSPDYRVLAEWIAAGAAPPGENDPKLISVEVLPEQITLQPGDEQQLIVTAHYSDGRQEDVTRWAKFSTADATVANVSPDGRISVIGHGQGAIVIWFSSRVVLAQITSPYDYEMDAELFAEAPERNFIDTLVLEKLASLNLAPSPPAGDAEFLRRVYLDTIGTLPTLEETTAFLDDSSLQESGGDDGGFQKRDRLIDELLDRKEFVDYWCYKWSDLLLVNGRRLRPKAVKSYYQWIRKQVEQNTPWDEMVRQILTATGDSHNNGETNFYALHQTPEDLTENVCLAFLGLSIGCAKCHDHPLEKWTNDQYYAMANLFARLRSKGWGGDTRIGEGLRTLYSATEGELVQPRTGKPQPPAPLDAEPIPFEDKQDRRLALANWLTSPENPYFSRAIVNRIWANFFGVGLIDPTDDLRVSNPPSNGKLLDALATWLVDNDFDIKALMRLILQSETYQRSSQSLAANQADRRFYSRYYPRRLMAEVLHDAIGQVTQIPGTFTRIANDGGGSEETKEYPEGTRAIELYDSAVIAPFLKTFGRHERNITCECERSNTPSLVQVLHINNGDTMNKRLQDENSCVAQALASGDDDETVLEKAFLRTLARRPQAEEKKELLKFLQGANEEDRRELIEDLYWGIMSSREFLFNH